jgi:pimeloyl-ACP methyl ester carboxylesterase
MAQAHLGASESLAKRIARPAGVFVLGGLVALVVWHWLGPRRIQVSGGTSPEELVYARAGDEVINGGVWFKPSVQASNVALIWIHGWGVNFHYPTYTMIGRRLAERGLPVFVGNTRMHDIGTVAAYREGRRVRGGGYWGIPGEEPRDVAAWIDLAGQLGYPRVVLAGHSAGWAPVVRYQSETADPRVVGLVLASGAVQPLRPERDETLLRQAKDLVAGGHGEDLVRLPNRTFPSFISAATLLDQAGTAPAFLDVFGLGGRDAAIARVSCPLLAFFGTRGDVGGAAELEAVKTSTARLSAGPRRIDTALISRADHMYTGEEAQVAQVIAEWVARAVTRTSR